MSKGVFIKTIQGLAPHNDSARDILARYKMGDLVTADVVKPRNLGMHRLWFALCKKVADNMPGNYNKDIVSDVIKVRTGHVIVVKTMKGELFFPKSISFAAMDQIQFKELFDRAIIVIVSDILPGINSDELRTEVELMLSNGSD